MSFLPPPSPTPPVSDPGPAGGTLVKSAWYALRQDRDLIGLPMAGGVAALLVVAPLLIVFAVVGDGAGGVRIAIGVVAAILMSVVTTFFAVALAAGAHERLGGGDPTFKGCLAVAWRRKRGVVEWALLSVTVGLVLRLIEDRLKGVAGFLVRILGNMAWAAVSFFAVPIIAANDVGAVEALKLSAKTFKDRWQNAVRVSFRLGLMGILPVVVLMVGGVIGVALLDSVQVLGIFVLVVSVLAFIAGVLVMSALGAYARVALYRYAAGLSTPGFQPAMLEAAVVRRKA